MNSVIHAVIHEGADNVTEATKPTVKIAQRYVIKGYAACDADNPNDAARDIIADLKRAVFVPESNGQAMHKQVRTVDYVGRTIGARDNDVSMVVLST